MEKIVHIDQVDSSQPIVEKCEEYEPNKEGDADVKSTDSKENKQHKNTLESNEVQSSAKTTQEYEQQEQVPPKVLVEESVQHQMNQQQCVTKFVPKKVLLRQHSAPFIQVDSNAISIANKKPYLLKNKQLRLAKL